MKIFIKNQRNHVAYDICRRGIDLPSFNDMKFNESKRVVELIKLFIKINA